ncbi:hypothetical protein KZ483_00105 [Paenibacillus sp. sptzw28]|uniref:hypothetical protein n=1 Tax=Paenibacillus sp. sptzw28 TaxID=715179 RepID=UPI001C6F01B1|nr:hypothetical protein [Paenibacillus sp. sptzw28]QYR21523.1 hypothetical protein KZ483_00105 [Paenibacillus sp. sptzw28]
MNNMHWILRTIFGLISANPAEGARTPVYLASSAEVRGVSGKFFAGCKLAKTTANADNADDARKLWDISMRLIGSGS